MSRRISSQSQIQDWTDRILEKFGFFFFKKVNLTEILPRIKLTCNSLYQLKQTRRNSASIFLSNIGQQSRNRVSDFSLSNLQSRKWITWKYKIGVKISFFNIFMKIEMFSSFFPHWNSGLKLSEKSHLLKSIFVRNEKQFVIFQNLSIGIRKSQNS